MWFNDFRLEGKKVKKARDINRPVVNVQWLNEILFGHLSCMYQPENVKYQQFNLNNPFRVDYNLVLHLMGKISVIITTNIYNITISMNLLTVIDTIGYHFFKFNFDVFNRGMENSN